MGRRSINTTKSGKYMNPTDQARKEARKQELKKNKKQRQMVRAAVLKGKDPQQILEEMEKIDQMEYNVYQPSPLNEKVLKEKRKKLRDTLDRVLSMYYKDDPDKWADLKRKQTDYEHKRNQMVAFYESVKSAQQVQIDEIPLPQLPQQQTLNIPSQIPLPAIEQRKQEHTIYSIATALKLQALGQPVREPPGCPPGPPPDINDDGEVDDYQMRSAFDDEAVDDKEDEDEEAEESTFANVDEDDVSNKPSSVQQKMVALSGQNVDDFMKEMETVQKKLEFVGKNNESILPPGTDSIISSQSQMMFHNRLPPGPPPGRPLLPPGPPPLQRLPPMRMPPPPPPPRLIRLPGPPPALGNPPTNNVLTAAPQLLINNKHQQQGATITAKPQIRNLSADITRFVPSTLRVKREDKKMKLNSTRALVQELKQKEFHFNPSNTGLGRNNAGPHTKDDAYKQFMKEMQNLL